MSLLLLDHIREEYNFVSEWNEQDIIRGNTKNWIYICVCVCVCVFMCTYVISLLWPSYFCVCLVVDISQIPLNKIFVVLTILSKVTTLFVIWCECFWMQLDFTNLLEFSGGGSLPWFNVLVSQLLYLIIHCPICQSPREYNASLVLVYPLNKSLLLQ